MQNQSFDKMVEMDLTDRVQLYKKKHMVFNNPQTKGQSFNRPHYIGILFSILMDSILKYITSWPAVKTASANTLISMPLVTMLGLMWKLAIAMEITLQNMQFNSSSRKTYIVEMLAGNQPVFFSTAIPSVPEPLQSEKLTDDPLNLYNKQKPQSHFRTILYTFYLLIVAACLLFIYKGCRA